MNLNYDTRTMFGNRKAASWQGNLMAAMDGQPWLILSLTRSEKEIAMDMLAAHGGLTSMANDDLDEAALTKVSAAAAHLYLLPIKLAMARNPQDAKG